MSADTLREAADSIRADWEEPERRGPFRDPARFHLAVADWLDATAAAVAAGSWPPGGAEAVARAYLGDP